MDATPTPSSTPRSQARGDTTKAKILDAVLELVASDGPRAVTYRRVAEYAGVTNGVMTYHYSTRRELIAAAYARHLSRVRDEAKAMPTAGIAELTRTERVDLVFDFVRHMAEVDRLRYLAEFEMTLEMARDPDLRREITPASELTRETAVALLTEAGASDPDADATIWSAAMEGLLLGWLARPDDSRYQARVREAIRRMVDLFFD